MKVKEMCKKNKRMKREIKQFLKTRKEFLRKGQDTLVDAKAPLKLVVCPEVTRHPLTSVETTQAAVKHPSTAVIYSSTAAKHALPAVIAPLVALVQPPTAVVGSLAAVVIALCLTNGSQPSVLSPSSTATAASTAPAYSATAAIGDIVSNKVATTAVIHSPAEAVYTKTEVIDPPVTFVFIHLKTTTTKGSILFCLSSKWTSQTVLDRGWLFKHHLGGQIDLLFLVRYQDQVWIR
jgi:hypothetical protein